MKCSIRNAVITAGFFACFLLTACSEDNPQNASNVRAADLLPASGEIQPWTCGDYEAADDFTSLYSIIDGDAQIYIDYGLVEGVIQEYEGGTIGGQPATLGLWIFDQGSVTNAENLLSDPVIIPNFFIPIPLGDEAYLDDISDYVAIHLRADRFYVKIFIDSNGDKDQAQSIATVFANNVISGIY